MDSDRVSNVDLAKDIGRLEGTLQSLGRTVDMNREAGASSIARLDAKLDRMSEENREQNAAISAAVKALQDQQNRVQGGLSALGLLLTAAATLGGIITWILNHVTFK